MAITLKKENGDLKHLDSNGRMYYIEGIEKLTQEVADVLMTTYVPERGWGATLNNLIGTTFKPNILNAIGEAFIQQAVEQAIDRLKEKQRNTNLVTNYELIEEATVQVFRQDSTTYTFYLEVSPIDGPDKLPASFSVKLSQQIPDGEIVDIPGFRP
jgi:hypothetical protein